MRLQAMVFAAALGLSGNAHAQYVRPDSRVTAERDIENCRNQDEQLSRTDAIGECTRIIESNRASPPEVAQIYIFRAWHRQESDDLAGARADHDAAVRVQPRNARVLMSRGWFLANHDEPQAAIADYDSAIALDDTNALAFNRRGLAYNDLEQYARAIEDFNRAMRIAPREPRAYNNRGIAYYFLEDYTRALEDYTRAIELDRDYPNARFNRGLVYERQGNFVAAIEEYDAAARLNTEYAGYKSAACEARAAARRELGTAQMQCDHAIQIEPDEATHRAARGVLGLVNANYEAAWADFDAAVRLDTENAYALYGRGLSAARLGRAEASQTDIARALEMEPDTAEDYAAMDLRP